MRRSPDRTRLAPDGTFGDTDAVLRDVLGYSEERIAALRASGALGSEPVRRR